MDIRVENLNKSYGQQHVLQDINVHFAAGGIHGLIGRNGSGKTVLFRCIAGYTRPDSGTVYVGGERIGQDIAYPRSLGLILEAPGFLPQFSGAFNLQLLLSIRNRPSKALIANVMARVGLAGAENKAVGKYSMGMRQRLGIAQALLNDPRLLILDEPTNGLDKQGVRDVHALLMGLKAQGKTILLASHNPLDITTLCDTVREMDGGVMTRLS